MSDNTHPGTDFLVFPEGSVILFQLMTPAAHTFVDECVEVPDHMWMGRDVVACEHGLASCLIHGIHECGLTAA